MNLSYRKSFLSLAIAVAVGVIVNTEQIQAAGRVDITALLKFAEQYNAENGNDLPQPSASQSHEKPVFTHKKTPDTKQINKTNQLAELKKKEAEVTRLQQQVAILENRLHKANVPSQKTQSTTALFSEEQLNNLGQIISVFKQAFTVDRQQLFKVRLDAAKQKLHDMEEQNVLLSSKNQMINDELSKLQQQLLENNQDAQQQHNETITFYAREVANLKDEKSQIEEQFSIIVLEKQQLQQELFELTQQLDKASLADNDAVVQLRLEQEKTETELNRQIMLLMQDQVAMQTQLMVANQEKEKLQQEIIELAQKLELVSVKQDSDGEKADVISEEMKAAFNQQLHVLNQEKASLQAQINEMSQEKEQLEWHTADLTQQLEALLSEQRLTMDKFKEQQQQMQADFDVVLKNEKLTLQAQLDSINQEKQKLEKEIQVQTKKQEDILANQEKTLAKYAAENSQYDSLKKQFNELTEQYQRLQGQFVSLTAVYPTIQNDILNKENVRLDYAAGVTLGQDILAIQAEQKKWGLKSNEQVILSGILDVFSDQVRLDEQTLGQVMAVSEKQIAEAREKFVREQAKIGGEYIAKFSQQKGAKKSEMGFWYLIDYPGDESIPDRAMIDIIINESLTDGTVIKDMEAQGIVLSHRIEELPPLFAHAIKLLKNHGSLTMVVPPELAYGKEGYQPYIPPDSTMVYHIRIADAYLVDK